MASETITKNDLKGVLDAVLSTSAVDYIIAEGTDGIWTYRKWNSGIAECWGRTSVSLASYTTVGSFSGYYTDFALPSDLFTSITTHEYTATVGSGFAMPASGMNTDTTSYRVYALATATGTQTCTFEMTAKGRWK